MLTQIKPEIFYVTRADGKEFRSRGYSILVDGQEVARLFTTDQNEPEMIVFTEDEQVTLEAIGSETDLGQCGTCGG